MAEVEKCRKIHDNVAPLWNWAYYGDESELTPTWPYSEYSQEIRKGSDNRVPVVIAEINQILQLFPQNHFSILDVGCGVGGFIDRALIALTEEHPDVGFEVTGIDISEGMINLAQSNLSKYSNVKLICDDITNPYLQFDYMPFDVATLMTVLPFYSDKYAKEILLAIRNALKEDGHLLVTDFAWSYEWGGFTIFSKPLKELGDVFFSYISGHSVHMNWRSKEKLENLINSNGFRVERSYSTRKRFKMKTIQVIVAKRI